MDSKAGLDGCGKSRPHPSGFDNDDYDDYDDDDDDDDDNNKNIILLLKHRHKAKSTNHGSHTQLSRRFALV